MVQHDICLLQEPKVMGIQKTSPNCLGEGKAERPGRALKDE